MKEVLIVAFLTLLIIGLATGFVYALSSVSLIADIPYHQTSCENYRNTETQFLPARCKDYNFTP